jgi:N-methylhydantoinase A/oxoprolinase/acetone carboxylase beta subunit
MANNIVAADVGATFADVCVLDDQGGDVGVAKTVFAEEIIGGA